MTFKHALYAAGAAVAAWLGWHAYQNAQVKTTQGGIPSTGSQAIQPATGKAFSGSAPQGQSTGNAQPPSSGVQQDVANWLSVGKDALSLGASAKDLLQTTGDAPQVEVAPTGGYDASAYPSMAL